MFLEAKEKTVTVQFCESLWCGVTVRHHRADEPSPISNNWTELNTLESWRVVYTSATSELCKWQRFDFINLGLWHNEVSSSSSSAT